MWVRSAFWVGTVRRGNEEQFRRLVDEELIPVIRELPGPKAVKALWPAEREDNPPQIALQVIVEFERREDIDVMLASPGRAEVRSRAASLASMFDGVFCHINYEVS